MKFAKSFLLVTITLCFFSTFVSTASAQWKKASGWSLEAHSGVLSQVNGFLPFGTKLLADVNCATLTNGTPDSLFVSTDNGVSWAPFSSNGGMPLISLGSNLIGIADSFSSGFVTRWIAYSTDQGQHWTPDSLGYPTGGYPGGMVVAGNSLIATAGYYGFFKQTAPGTPWSIDTVGASIGGVIVPTTVITMSGTTILAGALVAGILASTDNGGSWNLAVNGIPGGPPNGWPTVWQFGVVGNSVFAAILDPMVTGAWDIYRSSDNGQNWTLANSTPINGGNDANAVWFAGSGQTIFFSTDSGVFVSKNNGATWTLSNTGLPAYDGNGFYTTAMQVSGGNLVVGTADSGIWYRPLSDFGVLDVTPGSEVGNELRISVLENPAENSENVVFTLPAEGMAKVELMDELGRNVRMLQNGLMHSGENTVAFDATSLEPGTYFVRIEANGQSAMQKVAISR